jgi:hypothetical protein
MGTRSNIGIKIAKSKILSIYCHWDGYPSHHGRILLENYNTKEKVEELLKEGDMSILGEKCTKPEGHSFDNAVDGYCVYYGRDRGETNIEARIVAHKDFHQEEFSYYFNPTNNNWYWKGHSQRRYKKLTIEDTEKEW